MLRETIELHRQGRLDEAEQGYRAHVAANPNDVEGLRLLGILCRDRGALTEAATLIERAHELAPEQPNLLLMLGAIHFQNGDLDRSRADYTRALVLDPNLGGAHTTLGHIAMAKGEPELAEQHFRTALRVGEDGAAYAGLGTLLLDRGDVENAMKYLSHAADLSPNDAAIQFTLGRGFERRGMTAFAERAFLNALRLRPEFPHATHALAQLLINDKRPQDAEPFMRRLLDVPAFALGGALGLADIDRAQGRLVEAVEGYKRAMEMAPGHDMAAQALLWCLGQLDRVDEALALANEQIERFPQLDHWRVGRSVMFGNAQRFAEAAADQQVLHERDPKNPERSTQLAVWREWNRELDEAVRLAELTQTLAPGHPVTTFILARADLRKGDAAAATARLQGLATASMNEAQMRLQLNLLGRAADLAGDRGEAAQKFAAAQRGLPGQLPELAELSAELERILAEPMGEAWDRAPILLLGAPGSDAERIAALLADHPQISMLRDRAQGLRMRSDGFDNLAYEHALGALSEAEIQRLRADYLAPLNASGVGADRIVIDWIPRWDARLLAFVKKVMPGTRIIVAERDPRDALLNWMAFGWIPFGGFSDSQVAVEWAGRARRHVRHGLSVGDIPHLLVDPDQVMSDLPASAAELARFVGVDSLVAGHQSMLVGAGLGEMLVRFPPGHWQNYQEALAEPFARVMEAANTGS